MITVFIAEALQKFTGTERVDIYQNDLDNVCELKQFLGDYGDEWLRIFREGLVKIQINDADVNDDAPLHDGDMVTLYANMLQPNCMGLKASN